MTAAVPVRHYLTEIAGDGARQIADARLGRNGEADIQARLEEARARGAREGRAEADAEHSADLAQREAEFAARLAAERQRWASEEAARISELLSAGMLGVEKAISEQVARVLRPLVPIEVRRAAVDSLAQTLADMLANGTYARIKVSGPGDLVDALSAKLGEARQAVHFETSNSVDVVVNADDTVLETRIGAWVSAINGEVAPADRAVAQTRACDGDNVEAGETGGAL